MQNNGLSISVKIGLATEIVQEPGPAVGDGLLLETNSFILLETGDYLLLE